MVIEKKQARKFEDLVGRLSVVESQSSVRTPQS
jgi:hypothetical protein